MGGCLPMIVQIPIFYALSLTLQDSVELQGAYFVLWITDLSKKDPYYVLPILMGVSMLWQQKMTPTVGDPRQARVMLIMPVIFTFMFLEFPTGLVLYWLGDNVLSIAHQYPIDRAGGRARTAPGFETGTRVFLEELGRWSRVSRLTGYRSVAEQVIHLILDSLLFLMVIPEPAVPVLDIGSGPGVPGLVLKLARPAWPVTLGEANRRPATFMRHVVRRLGLDGAEIREGRAE